MISIVCVKDVAEVKKYLKINPDFIAIEPPELIGSGKAISTEKPDLIQKAASIVNDSKTKQNYFVVQVLYQGKTLQNQ